MHRCPRLSCWMSWTRAHGRRRFQARRVGTRGRSHSSMSPRRRCGSNTASGATTSRRTRTSRRCLVTETHHNVQRPLLDCPASSDARYAILLGRQQSMTAVASILRLAGARPTLAEVLPRSFAVHLGVASGVLGPEEPRGRRKLPEGQRHSSQCRHVQQAHLLVAHRYAHWRFGLPCSFLRLLGYFRRRFVPSGMLSLCVPLCRPCRRHWTGASRSWSSSLCRLR